MSRPAVDRSLEGSFFANSLFLKDLAKTLQILHA